MDGLTVIWLMFILYFGFKAYLFFWKPEVFKRMDEYNREHRARMMSNGLKAGGFLWRLYKKR